MRLHTSLDPDQVRKALQRAKDSGRVAGEVVLTGFGPHRSQTHPGAFEVQLGVPKSEPYRPLPEGYLNQYGKPQKARRTAQDGRSWSATWHEWGWFIAEVYQADPGARFGTGALKGSGYDGYADFTGKTRGRFSLEPAQSAP